MLSGGISEALITTAAGLSVGIPCLMFYRFFRSKIMELTVILEENALILVDQVKRSTPVSKPKVTRKKATKRSPVTKKADS